MYEHLQGRLVPEIECLDRYDIIMSDNGTSVPPAFLALWQSKLPLTWFVTSVGFNARSIKTFFLYCWFWSAGKRSFVS